jgi:hypothetical protein
MPIVDGKWVRRVEPVKPKGDAKPSKSESKPEKAKSSPRRSNKTVANIVKEATGATIEPEAEEPETGVASDESAGAPVDEFTIEGDAPESSEENA